MTDGILLAELQRDRDLRRYDTIVIDEAHERSLNIDFILGYLKSLLPRRPDLRVVVTSATIDPTRFAEHFATDAAGRRVREVPVLEVSGRTYPVEVRYRPLVETDEEGRVVADRDQVTGICEAVEELWTETPPGHPAPDILVFLSGEREIRDAADALAAMDLPQTEVLPLYARLSAAEQHRVFRRAAGRRVVLATNVAETSLTVPGIGYVVDTGTARISRYSQRTKVQRLPIEPVSQASAAQRAGRCGRLAPGTCIRLYSEDDHDGRPAFTEPEVQRTSLASVILQMTSLGLGDLARFPFVDPPDSRQVADGVRLLEELHALRPRADTSPGDRRGGARLTAYGRTLARLPLDPRLGRMLVEAGRLGCTREVLPVVAALSIQDPRERPADRQAQADSAHARFRHEHSDFATLLRLWRYVRERCPAAPSGGCAGRSSCTTCGCGSGRTCTPSCARRAARRASTRTWRRPPGTASRTGTACTRRCSPGCSRTWASATRCAATTSARAARTSPSRPARRCFDGSPTSSWPRSSSRPAGSGRAPWPASTRGGPRSSVPTSSSGPTASRGGRAARARRWRPSA
jgi:ATP-dependent helicase HrpA